MRDDALPARRILCIGAAIPLAIVFAIGVAFLLLGHRAVPPGGEPVAAPARLPDGLPMLQTAPQPDLAAYGAAQRRALDRAGWVDAASGVAHVPIDAAMAMAAARAASSGASR